MGRTFDNNAANYMSRASVNLGLNGATECSVAYWINITAVNTTNVQRVVQKQIADGWNTFTTFIATNSSQLVFALEPQGLGQSPIWTLSSGIGTGVWTRALWAWKRNAITSADAVAYVNGQSVSTTFTANGYAAGFALEESSNNLYYGIRPVTLTQPLNASLAWVCVWNRKLTATEAVADYNYPGAVTDGLIHCVKIKPDKDRTSGGNDMTVNGTLAEAADGFSRYWRLPRTWT